SNVDVSGTLSITCTRPNGNPRFPATFWIGTSGANGTRKLLNGSDQLTYNLFTSGCATAWSGTTGVTVANSLTANGDANVTITNIPFCLRITGGQNTAKALTFTTTETLTVRSTDSTGFSWGTGVLSLSGKVNALCLITTGNTLTFTYTSFQASDQTGSNGSFVVQCTNSTTYSLALDSLSGVAIGITYTLGLQTLGNQSVNNVPGTGNTLTYQVPGKIFSGSSGQAGTCASGSTCTGSDNRTVTVSY
ncbi:MAG TPA: spore coat protein U domain-containing protein, partial [Ramlibacter sp.]|nr:spore coat protein U domain-containing protein [Ramlibacter sp.]